MRRKFRAKWLRRHQQIATYTQLSHERGGYVLNKTKQKRMLSAQHVLPR